MRSDKELEKDQMKEKTEHMCKKMKKEDLLLYAVTDRHWLNGETLYSQVEKTLEGGTTFVQLREKELDEAHFLKEAKEIKELCADTPMILSGPSFALTSSASISLCPKREELIIWESEQYSIQIRKPMLLR